MTNPITFMQSIAGFTAANNDNGSADRPIKQATIDPLYVASSFPGTLPRVTFEGESTVSGKRYAVSSPYWPQPNDKVWMVPIGSTYLIAGSRDSAAPRLPPQSPIFVTDNNNMSGLINTTYAADTSLGIAFTAPMSGRAVLFLFTHGHVNPDSTNIRYFLSTLRIGAGSTIGAGLVELANGRSTPADTDAIRTGYSRGFTGAGSSITGSGVGFYYLQGLTPGGNYNAQERHRLVSASSGTTYTILTRTILYLPL